MSSSHDKTVTQLRLEMIRESSDEIMRARSYTREQELEFRVRKFESRIEVAKIEALIEIRDALLLFAKNFENAVIVVEQKRS